MDFPQAKTLAEALGATDVSSSGSNCSIGFKGNPAAMETFANALMDAGLSVSRVQPGNGPTTRLNDGVNLQAYS